MDADFDVAISSPVRDPEVQAAAQELETFGAHVEIEDRENRPQASIDILVAALVLLISRKYFETILEEAARDHYQALKRVASRLRRSRTEYQLQWVVSSSTPDKIRGHDGRVFSLCFVERPGMLLKFTFKDSITPEQEATAMERLFSLLEVYCRDEMDPRVETLRAMINLGPRSWRYDLRLSSRRVDSN